MPGSPTIKICELSRQLDTEPATPELNNDNNRPSLTISLPKILGHND